MQSVIFGANGELGRAILAGLRHRGDGIAAFDLSAPVVQEDEFGAAVNIADSFAVNQAVTAAKNHLGQIDCVINAAGIVHRSSLFDLEEKDFSRVLDVNLLGTFRITKAAAQSMRQGAGGSILHISSIHALRGMAGRTAYAASKGGMAAFIRAAAAELGPYNISINAIAPGPVGNGMGRDSMARSALLDATPMGRVADALEIAEAALFLTSSGARIISGQLLSIDGGASTTVFNAPEMAAPARHEIRIPAGAYFT